MRFETARATVAAALVLAGLAQPAWASATYRFTGAVTSISNPLVGAGLLAGDPVHMTVTLGPPVPDSDPTAHAGFYAGAIGAWTLRIGSFLTTGVGGDVLVCDTPGPAATDCGSSASYPWWNGVGAGKDGVRFVAKQLTSPPMVLNGYSQACWMTDLSCGNSNVYDDTTLALLNTDIPSALDPVLFNFSANNGRVLFGPQGFIGFSMAVVSEPSPSALVALGLGVLGLTARRRRV
jgi:hypothetical protein